MIRNITKYPNLPTVEFAVDVRVFDEELFSFIDDLRDTITEHNLDGLAATQVGSYFNVAVLKDKDGEFLELINPRILNKKGEITTKESTAYYGDNGVEITRYDNISLIYEDRKGEQHSLKTAGDFSVLIQRKIDYLFGANFTSKLSADEKEKFEKNLGLDDIQSCSTTPKKFTRDYFVYLANYVMLAMVLLLVSSFFISDEPMLDEIWSYQLYLSFSVLAINLVYIFYSYYENKRFSICTNCYNMSIFGVVAMGLFRLSMIMIASYLIIG